MIYTKRAVSFVCACCICTVCCMCICVYLYCLLKGPVQFLFDLLLEETGGFGLLDPSCSGLEATIVAGWIAFIKLRAQLLIHADHNHTCSRDTGLD